MAKKYLSGFELAEYMNHVNEHELPQRGGVKDYAPDEFNWLQAKQLDAYYLQRNEVLSEERVTRKSTLSRGEWIPNLERVEVTKHTGTFWLRAGYTEEGRMLLYPEEALFLMDSGQLEVFFGGVALSLQQAFSAFVGPCVTMEEYQVYAYLTRLGYIVRRHVPVKDLSRKDNFTAYEKQLNLVKSRSGKKKRNRKQTHLCDQKETLADEPKCKRDKEGNSYDNVYTNDNQPICGASFNTTSGEIGISSVSPIKLHCEMNVDNEIQHSTECTDSENLECRVMRWHPWNFEKCSTIDSPTNKSPSGFLDIEFPDISDMSSSINDVSDARNLPSVGLLLEKKLRKQNLKSSQHNVTNWTQYKRLSDTEVLKTSLGAILWNGPVTPLLKPQEALNTGTILKKLKVIENVRLGEICGESRRADVGVQLLYDIFQPDNNFRKSDPGTPYSRICVSRSSDPAPDLSCMAPLWQKSCDGVPVHVAVVDHGEINFSTFSDVDLPTDVTVG